MTQPRHSACLALKAFGEGWIMADFRSKDLDGDQPIQSGLPRFVNSPHSPFAEQFKNLKVRQALREFLDRGRYKTRGRRRKSGGSRFCRSGGLTVSSGSQ
jgi:hypothetical protein